MKKEEFQKLFLDGFEKVVLPHIEVIENDLASLHQDMDEQFKDANSHLVSIERKLDNTITRVDDHSVRLTRLEKSKS